MLSTLNSQLHEYAKTSPDVIASDRAEPSRGAASALPTTFSISGPKADALGY
jgi:hypothetical protein